MTNKSFSSKPVLVLDPLSMDVFFRLSATRILAISSKGSTGFG
jgi:hypothetical protein